MLDGKVINVLTGSSDSSCRFCQAKPKKLNEIDYLLSLEVSEDCKKYGICPMHARIRFVDLVLNVSYRDEEPNRVKFVTLPDPEKKNKRKYEIQRQFRTQMGLKVDYPAKGGSGNTTDGNTSRKIFANTQKSSEITGFDKEILNRFSVILDTINSGYQVDSQKFKDYSLQTARLYVRKYPWWPMNAAVHIILLHGWAVMDSLKIPMGELSEEAQESKNKDLKFTRTFRTRKCSEKKCNEDTIKGMLASSDPIIATINHSRKSRSVRETSKTVAIREEVRDLLATPEDPGSILYESEHEDENVE